MRPDTEIQDAVAQPALPFAGFNIADLQPLADQDGDDPRTGTLSERAERFHARNPHVYRLAVSVCRYIKSKGQQHYGMKAVWEIMRFKYFETHGDPFKLNNNWHSWYARKIMEQEADLKGFFEIRNRS